MASKHNNITPYGIHRRLDTHSPWKMLAHAAAGQKELPAGGFKSLASYYSLGKLRTVVYRTLFVIKGL